METISDANELEFDLGADKSGHGSNTTAIKSGNILPRGLGAAGPGRNMGLSGLRWPRNVGGHGIVDSSMDEQLAVYLLRLARTQVRWAAD
jgi:hypothetical protein